MKRLFLFNNFSAILLVGALSLQINIFPAGAGSAVDSVQLTDEISSSQNSEINGSDSSGSSDSDNGNSSDPESNASDDDSLLLHL